MAIAAPGDKKTDDLKCDSSELQADELDRQLWRDLVAYWILGLCNNLGYVVMLTAAHDIITQFNDSVQVPPPSDLGSTHRQCNLVSTGAILLADVIPMLTIKTVMPFVPFWVNTRIFASITFGALGFLLVAYANVQWVAILGVVCTSTSCGLGESTLLSYTSRFNRNVISTWSSGTGGAGIIGALAYAALCTLGMSSKQTMLVMLIFPAIECIVFWVLLREPKVSVDAECNDETQLQSLKQTLVFLSTLCKYMLPLITVYFFEYFINQGLFEFVHFKNTFLDKEGQYRWLCVDYQIGVFIARSSVNLIHIRKTWVLSLLQFLTTVYFLTEVIYYFTPVIWIVFGVVLFEGLLGGAAYVNTFYRMAAELSGQRQEFALGITVQADAIGIMMAGLLAIPAHNAICKLPPPERLTF